jgi:hypothetical protein
MTKLPLSKWIEFIEVGYHSVNALQTVQRTALNGVVAP